MKTTINRIISFLLIVIFITTAFIGNCSLQKKAECGVTLGEGVDWTESPIFYSDGSFGYGMFDGLESNMMYYAGSMFSGPAFSFRTSDRGALQGKACYRTVGFVMHRCKIGTSSRVEDGSEYIVIGWEQGQGYSVASNDEIRTILAYSSNYEHAHKYNTQYYSYWIFSVEDIIAAVEACGYSEWAAELRGDGEYGNYDCWVRFDGICVTSKSKDVSADSGKLFSPTTNHSGAVAVGTLYSAANNRSTPRTNVCSDLGLKDYSACNQNGLIPFASAMKKRENKPARIPRGKAKLEDEDIPAEEAPEEVEEEFETLKIKHVFVTEDEAGTSGGGLPNTQLATKPSFYTYNDSRAYTDIAGSHTWYDLAKGIPSSEMLTNGFVCSSDYGELKIGIRRVTKEFEFEYTYNYLERIDPEHWDVTTADGDVLRYEKGEDFSGVPSISNIEHFDEEEIYSPDKVGTAKTTRTAYYYFIYDLNFYQFESGSVANGAFPGGIKEGESIGDYGYKVQQYMMTLLHHVVKSNTETTDHTEYEVKVNGNHGSYKNGSEGNDDLSTSLTPDDEYHIQWLGNAANESGHTFEIDFGHGENYGVKLTKDDGSPLLDILTEWVEETMPFSGYATVKNDYFKMNDWVVLYGEDISVTEIEKDPVGFNHANYLAGTLEIEYPEDSDKLDGQYGTHDYLTPYKPEWEEQKTAWGYNMMGYETTAEYELDPLEIPAATANGEYYTAIENPFTEEQDGVVYKRVLYQTPSTDFEAAHSAGQIDFAKGYLKWSKGMQSGETILGSDKAMDGNTLRSYGIIKCNGNCSLFNAGGGVFAHNEPVVVHTPVISPISIYYGPTGPREGNYDSPTTDSVHYNTQLMDPVEKNSINYTFRLDEYYTIHFDTREHLQSNGYYDAATLDNAWTDTNSKYDKYIAGKYVHFSFDVIMNGVYYKTVDNESQEGYWIPFVDPEEGTYYIPTTAKEGKHSIEIKVEAQNVIDEYAYNHQAAREVEANLSRTNYVATYHRDVEISGWLYDFQVVGINDAETFNAKDSIQSSTNDNEVALCVDFNEKKQGNKNRLGGEKLRYTKTGRLYTGIKRWNLLPFCAGTATIENSNEGTLQTGSEILYSMKTIANLYDEGDHIEIIPKFRWVSYNGTETEDVDVYYIDESSASPNAYIRMNSSTDLNNIKNIYLGRYGFTSSYYDTDLRYSTTKKYGSDSDDNLTKYLYSKIPVYSLGQIKIPSSLRLFSGTCEQLKAYPGMLTDDFAYDKTDLEDLEGYENKNSLNKQYLNNLCNQYANTNFDAVYEDFKKSMQTWYGGYKIPSKIYITTKGTNIDEWASLHGGLINDNSELWLKDGYLILNFCIYAYKGNTKHLIYGSELDASHQWELQGADAKEILLTNDKGTVSGFTRREGDIAAIEVNHSLAERYESKIFMIN